MTNRNRELPPERQKGRTLSVSDPLVTAAVAAIAIEGFNVGDTTRWGNRLACAARSCMTHGKLGEDRRLTRREAESVWRKVFAGAGAR